MFVVNFLLRYSSIKFHKKIKQLIIRLGCYDLVLVENQMKTLLLEKKVTE